MPFSGYEGWVGTQVCHASLAPAMVYRFGAASTGHLHEPPSTQTMSSWAQHDVGPCSTGGCLQEGRQHSALHIPFLYRHVTTLILISISTLCGLNAESPQEIRRGELWCGTSRQESR